jgi:DNA-binding transcriptional LysR family regulator
MIEFRQLKHFLAVVEHGGVRQAGRAIHISGSAITRSIQMLEEHYCVELLTRDKQHMEPTAFGQQLAQVARDLVAGFEGVEERLKQVADLESGTLRVGIGPSISEILMPVVAARMARQHPRVQLEIYHYHATTTLAKLLTHELDVGVGHDRPFLIHGGLDVTRLYSETVEWWVRKEHPLARKRSVTVSDLASFPVASQFFPEQFQAWLQDVALQATKESGGQHVTHALQCTNYHILTSMALDSDVVLACPRQSILHSGSPKEFVNLPLPVIPQSAVAVALPRIPTPSPLARRFVAMLQDAAREMIDTTEETLSEDE